MDSTRPSQHTFYRADKEHDGFPLQAYRRSHAVIRIEPGDCLDVMKHLAQEGVKVDAVVTDPPYHLTSIVKRFGKEGAAPAKDRDGLFQRASKGFMGKAWDGGDVAFRPETWRLVFNLMKPGAFMFAFNAGRNYHRMAAAIDQAGFIIKDPFLWLFGTGFPKSRDVSVMIDAEEETKEWEGWGTEIKASSELICFAQKPRDGSIVNNLLTYRTGALNIRECLIPAAEPVKRAQRSANRIYNSLPSNPCEEGASARWPANIIHDGGDHAEVTLGDAARYFYCAKAGPEDRMGSNHPTVKPVSLLRYLARLITPPGGTILDPFAGSGTLASSALAEGFDAILIEREEEYLADIRHRISLHGNGPEHRANILQRNIDSVTAGGLDLPLLSTIKKE